MKKIYENPALTHYDEEEHLEHYGIIGMKWGKRKGSLGSRIKGQALDYNQQRTSYLTRSIKNTHTKGEKVERVLYTRPGVAVAKLALGKNRVNKIRNWELSRINRQTDRIKAGKTTLLDKGAIAMRTNLAELVISRRDNKVDHT